VRLRQHKSDQQVMCLQTAATISSLCIGVEVLESA